MLDPTNSSTSTGALRQGCPVVLGQLLGSWTLSMTRAVRSVQNSHLISREVWGGGGDSLRFGTGVLMPSNFLRPPSDQTNFFNDPK